MKATEVKEKNEKELFELSNEFEKEIFNLKFKLSRGELKQTSNIRKVKRDLARVKTELKRRENAGKEERR